MVRVEVLLTLSKSKQHVVVFLGIWSNAPHTRGKSSCEYADLCIPTATFVRDYKFVRNFCTRRLIADFAVVCLMVYFFRTVVVPYKATSYVNCCCNKRTLLKL